MAPNLAGAFERVARAGTHIAELKREIGSLFERQRQSIVCSFEDVPPYTIKFDLSRFPGAPFIIGILIGEACYNLRSALDFLVFSLAELDSGSPQTSTQFPIEDTEKKFRDSLKHRMKGVSGAHIDAIEKLQPYHAGNEWTGDLRDYSNSDKHREFVVYAGRVHVDGFTEKQKSDYDRIYTQPIKVLHPKDGEVDVKLEFASEMLLRETPIINALEIVQWRVAAALEEFKPEFEK